MEQDLDLVVLTCDALLQGVDTILDPFGLFTLQFDQRLAVEVDLIVKVSNPTLLCVHQGPHIVVHGLKTTPFDLQLVNRLKDSRQPIIQTIIGRQRGSFQFIETPLGILDVVDQAIPNIVQQQDSVVDPAGKPIKLLKGSVITL